MQRTVLINWVRWRTSVSRTRRCTSPSRAVNGSEQFWVQPSQAGQLLTIHLIGLIDRIVDESETARIGDEDFVASLDGEFADPPRVRAHLQHNTACGLVLQSGLHSCFLRSNPARELNVSTTVQHAEVDVVVSEVEANSPVGKGRVVMGIPG